MNADHLAPYVEQAAALRDSFVGRRTIELLAHPWARLQHCPIQAAEIIGRILDSDDCLSLLEQRARLQDLIADEANREANREWIQRGHLTAAMDLYQAQHARTTACTERSAGRGK